MQFQIPQFIEVEDKIFGPLTFKQFIYLAGAAGGSYLLWRVLPLIVAAPLILTVVGLAAALAFFQYNGRPFIIALEDGFSFVTRPKLYLWNNERKEARARAVKTVAVASAPEIYVPRLSDSKLRELSWSLDIKERIAQGVASDEEKSLSGGVISPISPIQTMRDAMRP